MSDTTANPLETPVARAAQERAERLKAEATPLDSASLDLLFREARSHNGWQERPVSDALLKELYEIIRWGSTSMNCCPARFVFVRSKTGKERLLSALAPANIDKVLAAPVTVIIAYDLKFHSYMPQLFPHRDVTPIFENDPEFTQTTAFRNGTLQGAYLMLAARSMGLDCGPISGFDNDTLDTEFFANTSIKSNFLCSLGYGDTQKVFQRLPRLDFSTACELT